MIVARRAFGGTLVVELLQLLPREWAPISEELTLFSS
jgi:hypothetical protein